MMRNCILIIVLRIYQKFGGPILFHFSWFRQAKYSSFQRQLNIYGFKCISGGKKWREYYHPSFLRGNFEDTYKIKRFPVLNSPDPPSSSIMSDLRNRSMDLEHVGDIIRSFGLNSARNISSLYLLQLLLPSYSASNVNQSLTDSNVYDQLMPFTSSISDPTILFLRSYLELIQRQNGMAINLSGGSYLLSPVLPPHFDLPLSAMTYRNIISSNERRQITPQQSFRADRRQFAHGHEDHHRPAAFTPDPA